MKLRLKKHAMTPEEDARVGLAGPFWGLGAALVCLVVHSAGGGPIWAAIARVGAWINLFNLLPIWQLDGGRGFRSMSSRERWFATATIGAAWFLTGEGLLVLLLLGAIYQSFTRRDAEGSDRTGLIQYVFLIGVLSWMCTLEVPMDQG